MTEYHVRRKDRAITDAQKIAEIVRAGRYITLAMCAGDEPYAVTLSYGFDEPSSRLYFHVAHKGMKLDFIAANPRVCGTVVLAGDYRQGECEHPYESVVVRGTVRIVEDPAEKTRALRTLIEHLEDDASGYWAKRTPDAPEQMVRFTALCLDIEHMTGKAGS